MNKKRNGVLVVQVILDHIGWEVLSEERISAMKRSRLLHKSHGKTVMAGETATAEALKRKEYQKKMKGEFN